MRNNLFKKLLLLVLVISLGIFITGCKKREKKEVPKKEEPIKEVKKVTIIDTESKTRPFAVMIDNSAAAREHQHGLQKAYMVYEILNYIDGRTRFMAFYKDIDVERISPIRSARVYHVDYVLENDAIYVHWGYSPQAQADLKALGINTINGLIYGGKYFWTPKDEGSDVSHKRCTSTELLNKAVEAFKYNKETEVKNLLSYSAEAIINSGDNTMDANNVTIAYANNNVVGYTYDSSTGLYLRDINGKAHKDMATGEQITVKNIITYKILNTTIKGDDGSRQELHNIGEGTGYFITNGKATTINWSKSCRECQTKYTYLDGSEVVMNDGNTFINIQPEGKELKIS